MTDMMRVEREDRCPGQSYTDMLENDTRRVPDYLLIESNQDLGDEPISTERYTSAEFAAREAELMWPNVWQFAAREEELPDPGDSVVYEINHNSYLLIRQPDGEIRAFHNVCLHRGRKLRTQSGKSINLRCAFHGFTWNNDGSLKEIPCAWDFKHLKNKNMSLPELRVNRWQGYVMLTENQDIPEFVDWIGPGVEHYENWRLDECYTGVWIGRVIPANWKATAEAFMEAWHSVTTHPQLLPFLGDANSRYDLYGDHMNRAITPSGVLSPHVKGKDQNYVLQKMSEFAGGKDGDESRRFNASGAATSFSPDDPYYARKVLADASRTGYQAQNGRDYSAVTDSELLDNFTYNVFPNFAPWGGFVPNLVYRWRPWKDADHCLMEVRILMRTREGETPPRAPEMFLIPDDQPFMAAAHLIGEALANVFDQDMSNLPFVQEGMKASGNKLMELGHYQDSRVRHFNATLDKYLSGELPLKR
jgi:phenylpropionate dioxygenase-like ring-hydroxylating dioxygenase large terminal subunit